MAVVSVGSAGADDCVIGIEVVPTQRFAGTAPVPAKSFTFQCTKAPTKEGAENGVLKTSTTIL